MLQFGCGHGTSYPAIVPITVSRGSSVNISNIAGSSVGYLLQGINGPQTTLTAGNNVNVTTSTWLVPSGVSTIQLKGSFY